MRCSPPVAKHGERKSERMLSLDILRALAVLLVIVHHAAPGWFPEVPGVHWGLDALNRAGWLGVDLFFVLSGFLISGLLFNEHRRHGAIRFGRFFVRRGLKIYPAFYALLAVSLVVAASRGDEVAREVGAGAVLSEALFVTNYTGLKLWPHTWSLAVEEHFYVLLPLLLLGLARWRRNAADPFSSLPRIFLAFALAALVFRLVNASVNEYTPETHFKQTHIRIDGMLFGVFLSYLYHYRGDAFRSVAGRAHGWLILAGIVLWMPFLFMNLRVNSFIHTFGFAHIWIGSGLILTAMVVRGVRRTPWTRALGYVGTHSYSIYLWHLPVKFWLVARLQAAFPGLRPELLLAVFVLGSIAVGIAMALLIETPVLRLRDRLLPSRSKAVGKEGREAPDVVRPHPAPVREPAPPGPAPARPHR